MFAVCPISQVYRHSSHYSDGNDVIDIVCVIPAANTQILHINHTCVNRIQIIDFWLQVNSVDFSRQRHWQQDND